MRTIYPTLEKNGVRNIAVCKNQGKQCEFNDHWKSIKIMFLKETTGDDTEKTKRLTGIQVSTKDFASYKIGYKYLRKRK